MKCFITGANGFIGSALLEQLLAEGHSATCLIREPQRFNNSTYHQARIVKGDLDNRDALLEGMKGCDTVFHLAAYTWPWSKDPGLPYKVNVNGTIHVLEAAKSTNIQRFVFVSSGAVIGPSGGARAVDEETVRTIPFFNAYEVTKSAAEKEVLKYASDKMQVVIVYPTRVFGPGIFRKNYIITSLIEKYIKGTWRFIPGDGSKMGNYVYIDDVVNGLLYAAIKGATNGRYILGGENISFDQLFNVIKEASGKNRFMIHLPLGLMIGIAKLMEAYSNLTGFPPFITSDWVRKYMHDWCLSSKKAQDDLGYEITPFPVGIRKTITWLDNARA